MNTEWRRFLEQSGARITQDLDVNFNGGPRHPAHPAPQGMLMDLSRLALLEVSGKDALEFLNGQFTTNIKQLANDTFQYSAWCNPQGRVITLFIIYCLERAYYLLIPTVLKDRFQKRLQMYVLRSDVVINDRSGDLVCLGIISNEHVQELSATPETPGNISSQEEFTSLRVDSGALSRLLVTGPVPAMKSLWNSLQRQMTGMRSSFWQYLDISTGIPWIQEATTELFLPQELNLDITGGVSFDKGCFPGQEVIARVHYRGKVKQRLHRATIPIDSRPPAPGEKLYAHDTDESAGVILNTADSGMEEYAILAVADTERAAAGVLHIGSRSGPPVRFEAAGSQ